MLIKLEDTEFNKWHDTENTGWMARKQFHNHLSPELIGLVWYWREVGVLK